MLSVVNLSLDTADVRISRVISDTNVKYFNSMSLKYIMYKKINFKSYHIDTNLYIILPFCKVQDYISYTVIT